MIIVDESEPIGEIEPPFESRDVLIRRGVNVRDYYVLEEEIGRGKFGTVYKCREKATGLRLAAKFVQAPKKADRLNVEREVEIMKSLRNSRLIQLYDAYDDGKKEICLLLELIEGGELFERVIDDDFVLTERACAIFMRQICEGIQFIHLQHVLHLDMKPENILCLTRAGNRIKLIDFGLARRFDPSKKLQVLFGTPEFVAPEVVNFEQIGYGTDLWSVGIICYVLLSGLSPFMGETDVETMANVTIAKYDFDDEAFNDVSPEAKDFISKLLIKQISKRMTATECLRHPWLRLRPPLPSAQQQSDAIASAGAAESSQTSSSADDDATEAEMMMDSLSASPSPSPSPTLETTGAVVQQQQEQFNLIQNLPPPQLSMLTAPAVDVVMEQPPVINHKVSVVEEATVVQQQVVAEQVLPLVETIIREPSATATVIRSIPIAMETVQVQSALPAAVVVHPQVPLAVARPISEESIFHHQSSPASKELPQQVIQQSASSSAPCADNQQIESSPHLNEPKELNILPVTPPPQKNPVQDRFKSNKTNNKTPITPHPMTTTRKSSNIEAIQNKFSNKFNNNSGKSNVSYSRQSSATKKTPSTAASANASSDAASSQEVLQLTKVNLRQFVERWSSHPSSPFQLLGESSNRGTISLLISSPTVKNAPWSEPQQALSLSSAETKEAVALQSKVLDPAAVPVSKLAQVQQQSTFASSAGSNNNHPNAVAAEEMTPAGAAADIATAAAIEASVETAIEQTTALLKSVKESLIKQMESGTAVRDRTGARVWDRIGSGGFIGSPVSHRRPTLVQPLQQQEQLEISETVSMDYSSLSNNNNETTPMDEWEVHAPVAAKTFGFAKRHKTVASSKSVLVAKTEESSSMTYSLTSTVIQHQQMSSQSHNQQ